MSRVLKPRQVSTQTDILRQVRRAQGQASRLEDTLLWLKRESQLAENDRGDLLDLWQRAHEIERALAAKAFNLAMK